MRGYIIVDQRTLSEIDYLHKLSESEKAWLNRFLDNEYNARYFDDGHDIITDKNERRFLNKMKARRRNTFDNRLWPTSGSDGFQNLILINNGKSKNKKNRK